MDRQKGFTLVELVIVIIIVGILSVVSVPIYRGYVEKSYFSEGEALIGAIKTAETAYSLEHNRYIGTDQFVMNGTDFELDVDSTNNKYFRYWRVSEADNDRYRIDVVYNKDGSTRETADADYAIAYWLYAGDRQYEMSYFSKGEEIKRLERY